MRQPYSRSEDKGAGEAAARAQPADTEAVFVTHPIFRAPAWGSLHPLAISRQAPVLGLCEALGWLPAPAVQVCAPATTETLTRFHAPDYVAAFEAASRAGLAPVDVRTRFNFGTLENPIFPGIFERATASVGGSICAAQQALNGQRAFHPAGGTHHGRRDRASGFCYFNDPVFAIQTLLDGGAADPLLSRSRRPSRDGVEAALPATRALFSSRSMKMAAGPIPAG
ncbi:MAG: hypothetical protein R3C25_07515 [Hyphomonadaceae bacterium]